MVNTGKKRNWTAEEGGGKGERKKREGEREGGRERESDRERDRHTENCMVSATYMTEPGQWPAGSAVTSTLLY